MTDSTLEFEALSENRDLKAQITKLQGQLHREKQRNIALTTAAREGARDAILQLGKPPKVPEPKYRAAGDGKPEVAVLHLSDWQIGKKTTSFDSEVAEARLTELGHLLEEMTEIERGDHPVTECHLLLGGDMVEGVNIFPGQQWEIDSTLFEQHARASRCIVNLTRHAARVHAVVHIWEEDGNHGRIGRKGDMPKGDNADKFVYFNARGELRDLIDEGRVVWHETTNGWHSIVTIGNYRALLVHGDEIKSFGGQTPAFGIAKKVSAWAAGVTEPFIDCYMGHWHTPMSLALPVGNRRVFVNPSIESGNIYAQEFVGANGFPGQRLVYINPVRGRVTSERILWLD